MARQEKKMRRNWLPYMGGWRSAGCTAVALYALATSVAPANADTIRSQQWYLDAMHAEEIWRTSTGAGVTVAVIDSGVDGSLPDLHGQVLPGKDFSGIEEETPPDYEGHGTGMAVLIAGTGKSNGGQGSFGLAPGAKILPLRVANDKAPRTKLLAGATVYRAVRYAADSDAKIINISMGMPAGDPEGAKDIEYALSKGKIIFASAGNRGDKGNDVEYPAAYPGVVGVAAVDQEIKAPSWSRHGPEVDLAAPGDNMVTACLGGTGVCRGKGTSAATALTSASAALLWSAHPDWTANQVLRVLINTAGGPKSGEKRSDSIGYGVVRPRVALQTPGDPGPADVSPLPELAAAKSPAPGTASSDEDAAHRQAAEPKKDGSSLLSQRNVLAVGVAAAVILASGASVLLKRRRRTQPK
ncbi:type VII secretion-associated serine protease mycosin [Streptomyces hesseae]|uniref:Type VII secretion-associated serine protease mycosin n=1 Tax=Streptomyces hesseae TaxID=3075519 RepID=A0ABU2SNH8_9ACTN|nr:type VII secretion-associated serine protease mycosin [Streptomyces sp. DSM 40473]MDT0450536.1 type VII secretion-associated serine protease mycosin [Streptomyces sp. DSM 40473]